MELVQATNQEAWVTASEVLSATAERLTAMGVPLWTGAQVSPRGLANAYDLSELFFLKEGAIPIGVVFLQESDIDFWPEVEEDTTLFVHKLAILPEYCGLGYGAVALALITGMAARLKMKWVRLDCDDRRPLRQFYEENGFRLVDRTVIDGFNVVRYQMPMA